MWASRCAADTEKTENEEHPALEAKEESSAHATPESKEELKQAEHEATPKTQETPIVQNTDPHYVEFHSEKHEHEEEQANQVEQQEAS